jgi:FtsP/CotA-like multicopper oxidase with cupredoxin domain
MSKHKAIITALLAAAGLLTATASAGAAGTGLVCTTGTSFDLVAKSGYVETPDGNSVYMWGFANNASGGSFQIPGPNLCVNEGDSVTVHLRNGLTGASAEPVSIVFPGQVGVSAGSTGSAGLFTREAPVGGDVTYTFTASNPGTYLYESGTDPQKQVEMGLYGALIVRPAACAPTTCNAYDGTGTTFDPRREYLVVLHEFDPDLHRAVLNNQPYDRGKLHNRYFTVNGRSFPDTLQANNVSFLPSQPYGALVKVKPYDATKNPNPALIRMVNAGLDNHPFHPHGNHLRMIAQDGRRFLTPGGADASTEHFGETIASGSTEDFLLTWNPDPTDPNSPSHAFPVAIPSYRNLLFKDNNTWYSGSPYLGYKGTLPSGVTSQNVCGEFYFPWHSHALEEFVNYDVPFGGMATLLRVDPLNGCTSFPTSVKLQAGTLRGGGYAGLGADDNSYYQVNSTTAAPFRTDWYGGFTGVPAGSSNLSVTYIGKNSTTGITQQLAIWKWTTPQGWVTFGGSNPVGTAETPVTASPPGAAGQYIGTGTSKGQVRVQVVSTRTSGSGTFFSSGELLNITYDAP